MPPQLQRSCARGVSLWLILELALAPASGWPSRRLSLKDVPSKGTVPSALRVENAERAGLEEGLRDALVPSPTAPLSAQQRSPVSRLLEKNRLAMGAHSKILVQVPQIGRPIYVHRDVFNPTLTNVSPFLADHLSVQPGDTVLDVGSGTGYQAIIALYQGAQRAVALDRFDGAIANINDNADWLGLRGRLEARHGSVLAALTEGERFSLIVINPPLLEGRPREPLEAAVLDERYELITQFMQQAKRHLLPRGRIQIVYSSTGLERLRTLAAANEFHMETLATKDVGYETYYVFALTDANAVPTVVPGSPGPGSAGGLEEFPVARDRSAEVVPRSVLDTGA